jgi:hypothetical protein
MFSDFWEVPGEWKTALKAELEKDPPILGWATLGGGTGPTGPAGPPGPGVPTGGATGTVLTKTSAADYATGWATPAGSDKNYVHNQVTAAPNWTVVHNLGKYPAISVVDTGGNMIIPDVTYVDVNTVALAFAGATSGKAYAN